MSKTLYLECQAGISGDMTVAALLDLGADENVLREALQSLPVDGYEIRISQVTKSGIVAKDFDVIPDAEHESHDHDMEYLHGHEHEHNHAHHHEHEHDHAHHHEHRSMADILEILHKAKLSVRARNTALRIFDILAQAEAKAHGTTVEQVHFHEVGAVDSIVDIVAAAVCLDNLDITQVIVPKLCEGSGSVRCQHGVLPVPVPAVANIVSAYGIDLEIMPVQGEFVTPTGAAIVAAVRTSEELPEKMKIERIGIGAGKRTYEKPSLLRAMLIQNTKDKEDCIYKLESNIDDTTGEALGYLMERLMQEGAADVSYLPVFMKKNRPAYLLQVICCEDKARQLEDIIFMETTTIGIRKVKMERRILSRRLKQIQTSLGTVTIKECEGVDGIRSYPEYEDIKQIAKEKKLSFQTVYDTVRREM